MWRWDQGHVSYFDFETVRRIAKFVVANDFRKASRPILLEATGRDFAAPLDYTPWRNYGRTLKVCLLVSEDGKAAQPTAVAEVLATDTATSDEYLHFLARATTEPSPAFENYDANATMRFPLLFALKYLLAKRSSNIGQSASINEIISAFEDSHFIGDEDQAAFLGLVSSPVSRSYGDKARQSRESLRILSQISYLHTNGRVLYVSLDIEDATYIFEELDAIGGNPLTDRNAEIQRRAALFRGGSDMDALSYTGTVINEVVEAGFKEGGKLKKTHVVIERNSQVRNAFFKANPTSACDLCSMDTNATYPWSSRVLDLHHLLPLASGRRTDGTKGTIFTDLVPVCPSCHRGIHRFYDKWLSDNVRRDFETADEARAVYQSVKSSFQGHQYV